MIFDTHAHYDDSSFDNDRKELLVELHKEVDLIVNCCAGADDLKRTYELTKKYDFIYGAYGVHPEDAKKVNDVVLKEVKDLSFDNKAVAIGEIGLDYYWEKDEKIQKLQKEIFYKQLIIARERKLPFIIHSRDAAKDTVDIIGDFMKGENSSGVIHCFSYSKEIAREFLNMNLYLGIGGVLTFKNAKKLKEVVDYAPIENLVLETDCPYLAPEPNRGKRNDSRNLVYVAKAISEIKNIPYEEVCKITYENGKKLFKL